MVWNCWNSFVSGITSVQTTWIRSRGGRDSSGTSEKMSCLIIMVPFPSGNDSAQFHHGLERFKFVRVRFQVLEVAIHVERLKK